MKAATNNGMTVGMSSKLSAEEEEMMNRAMAMSLASE